MYLREPPYLTILKTSSSRKTWLLDKKTLWKYKVCQPDFWCSRKFHSASTYIARRNIAQAPNGGQMAVIHPHDFKAMSPIQTEAWQLITLFFAFCEIKFHWFSGCFATFQILLKIVDIENNIIKSWVSGGGGITANIRARKEIDIIDVNDTVIKINMQNWSHLVFEFKWQLFLQRSNDSIITKINVLAFLHRAQRWEIFQFSGLRF